MGRLGLSHVQFPNHRAYHRYLNHLRLDQSILNWQIVPDLHRQKWYYFHQHLKRLLQQFRQQFSLGLEDHKL